MAIIKEDGTGVANSNAYADEADANAHAEARQITQWMDVKDMRREAALLKASAVLDTSYEFKGRRLTRDQSMRWPRVNVIDDEGYTRPSNQIPPELFDACLELAMEDVINGLLVTQSLGGGVKKEITRIEGAVTISKEYRDTELSQATTLADNLLFTLLADTNDVVADLRRS